jgi:AraC family transcriptional regulator
MPTAAPILYEEAARHETLAAQMQAVERAIQVMHTHLEEVLTLEDLASAAYLSPSHFHRVFCRLTGVPPGEFLAALRFQTARRLLLTTSLSVTDICFEVGYTSTGSFTTRFTQLVGLSPRVLRRRASAFEPLMPAPDQLYPTSFSDLTMKHTLLGQISTPASFRGTIYIGLFAGPIPQGMPVRCTRLSAPGWYLLQNVPDGVYHLRAAAFPAASDLHSALLPGEKQLVGSSTHPLVMSRGQVSGNRDLVLHPPRLTDPPLVMGLPLI